MRGPGVQLILRLLCLTLRNSSGLCLHQGEPGGLLQTQTGFRGTPQSPHRGPAEQGASGDFRHQCF